MSRCRWAVPAAAVFVFAGAAPAAAPTRIIGRTGLAKAFRAPEGATFIATQSPDVDDPVYEGEKIPGPIHLCIKVAASASCAPNLDDALAVGRSADIFSEIHFLEIAHIVYPRGPAAPALLHLQVASAHSGDGDQVRAARILAYRPRARRFEIIFHEQFGRNRNEEARYIASGPLKGAMITVEPTENAPFGYWVAVSRLMPDYTYQKF